MIKHAILFAAAILLTAYLLRDTEGAAAVISTVLVPLWFMSSLLMRQQEMEQNSGCVDEV
ncbi:MAG: hypothetical protein WAM60_14215 [Candidatus Promineifilaceae bacterium]